MVIVCVLAYLLSGHRSIYPAQRLLRAKGGRELERSLALRDVASEGVNGEPSARTP